MKLSLNNKKIFKKYDTGQVLESIKNVGKQCRQAKDDFKKIKIPKKYKSAKNIIVLGMGGSNIGSDLLRYTFLDKLKIPLYIVADYNLPEFASKDSLIIASSYSGDTEEPIFATQKALKKKCLIFGVSSGGRFSRIFEKQNIPAYIFKPFYNPSGQPRLGIVYIMMSQLMLFKKLNLIKITDKEINEAIMFLEKSSKRFYETIRGKNNLAKQVARACHTKIPVIFTGNHLIGNAHIIRNQLHENSKNFACFFDLPELNHHLLEGLIHPATLRNFVFLCLESNLDLPKVKKRFQVTKKILKKKKLRYLSIKVQGEDRLSQSLWTLTFGSFFTFYLAMLNHENPVLIPWVDYFKKELSVK